MPILDSSHFQKAEADVEPLIWVMIPGLVPSLEKAFHNGQCWFIVEDGAYDFRCGQFVVVDDERFEITDIQSTERWQPGIFPPGCDIVSMRRVDDTL